MKIFISYRRVEDKASNIVYIIHNRLSEAFGEQNVFRDTHDIYVGTGWRTVLDQEVNNCKIMLVVIGPDWSSLTDPNGNKRILQENDVTRWEVETGLRRRREENIAVVPVLVQGAKFPAEEDLPPALHEMLEIQSISLRNDPDLDRDLEKLIHDIRKLRVYREDDIKIQEEFEPKTIYIAEGTFWMGSPPGEGIPSYETPQHEVYLPAYRIGKYPVTNSQYQEFISRTKTMVSPFLGWDGQKYTEGFENYPVTGVTWYEALAYCQWLSKRTGRKYSLPNEAQWEKACRGGNNSLYPWGDEFDPKRCNFDRPKIAPVDCYPPQNDFGCFDLVGNIYQWTCSLWGKKRFPPDPQYSYPWKGDRRNDLNADGEIRRVVRGSSMSQGILAHRCCARSGQIPEDVGFSGARYGFRVVRI